MTDKEINKEAKMYFEKYGAILTSHKDAWMKAYLLAYKSGQIEGMKQCIKKV